MSICHDGELACKNMNNTQPIYYFPPWKKHPLNIFVFRPKNLSNCQEIRLHKKSHMNFFSLLLNSLLICYTKKYHNSFIFIFLLFLIFENMSRHTKVKSHICIWRRHDEIHNEIFIFTERSAINLSFSCVYLCVYLCMNVK